VQAGITAAHLHSAPVGRSVLATGISQYICVRVFFHRHQTNVPVLANMQHLVHVYTRFIIMLLPRWNAYTVLDTEVHSFIIIHINT
jgi:hypothetical protein